MSETQQTRVLFLGSLGCNPHERNLLDNDYDVRQVVGQKDLQEPENRAFFTDGVPTIVVLREFSRAAKALYDAVMSSGIVVLGVINQTNQEIPETIRSDQNIPLAQVIQQNFPRES